MSNSNVNRAGVLFPLAVLATLTVWLTTPFGVGINPDSTVYIDAARNLLNGRGLVALTGNGEFKPLTHYPPLYPALLALLTRTSLSLGGFSIESVARVLNSLLFGANVLLVGIAVRSYARDSYWLPVLGALLTLTAADIAGIHTFALTEGLFIFLAFSGLLSLSHYVDTKRRAWLIACAALIALGLLTRYVGVALVLTGVLVLVFLNGRTLWRRCVDALLFGMIGCAPIALWVLGNMRVADGMTDREIGFHPVRLRQIVAGLSTMSTWLLLGKVRTEYRVIVFVVEVAAAGLFATYLLRRRRADALVNNEHIDDAAAVQAGMLHKRRSSKSLPVILQIFSLTYVAFLIFTAFFIDADTVLDDRALVPVHVAAIVLVCGLVWKAFDSFRERRAMRISFVALAMVFLVSYSIRGAMRLIHTRQDGQGYASRAWQESKTIADIKKLPTDVPLYSNGYDAIYYLTHRPAIYLPEKVKHGTGRLNENYEAELERMSKVLRERDGRLVYFNTLPERWFLPSESELNQLLELRSVDTNADGSVYATDR